VSLYSLLPLLVKSKRFKPIERKLPLDVCSPLFEGTKGSRIGILARKNIRSTSMAQANTYIIIPTINKHGKR
jgi:hypothetical protein